MGMLGMLVLVMLPPMMMMMMMMGECRRLPFINALCRASPHNAFNCFNGYLGTLRCDHAHALAHAHGHVHDFQ